MKRYVFAALFGLALTSTVGAQDNAEKLGQALLVEWIVANCDHPDSVNLTAMMASMVINGSDPAEVERFRAFIREGVKENYPSTEAACAELLASMG